MSQGPGCQGCRAASQGNKKETPQSATELLHNRQYEPDLIDLIALLENKF